MACLNARTAKTGAGVSGASMNALVSWSVAFVSKAMRQFSLTAHIYLSHLAVLRRRASEAS
jgi:hypothetical protein